MISNTVIALFKEIFTFQITGTESVHEMLYTLITCPDFSSGYNLRVGDKRFLNELNKSSADIDCIRFPIQGKVKTVTDKISW